MVAAPYPSLAFKLQHGASLIVPLIAFSQAKRITLEDIDRSFDGMHESHAAVRTVSNVTSIFFTFRLSDEVSVHFVVFPLM